MADDRLNDFAAARGPQQIADSKPLNSGEHVWVGDDGATAACEDLDVDRQLLASIHRLDRNVRLSYGEIVALSGDFYATPEELFEERSGAFSWIYEGKDISDLQEMFQVEVDWIRNDKGKNATNYPDQNLRMWWNSKGYLELALANDDHFGWHNMKAYVKYHGEALALAEAAAGEDDTFRRALCTNAFADHFLTDGFAAGHVRVPRREIRAWAKGAGYSEKLAGALSKLLHDQDGHVVSLHSGGEKGRAETDGLAVRNAQGDKWFTRCDGQLFLPPEADQTPAVQLPIRAVAASVGELLVAWQQKELPPAHYAATALVAAPDPKGPTLIQKFATDVSDGRVQQLLDSVGWYTSIPWIGPGLKAGNLREFLGVLPDLMGKFRASIAADLADQPQLKHRLAAGYVDAYRNVA